MIALLEIIFGIWELVLICMQRWNNSDRVAGNYIWYLGMIALAALEIMFGILDILCWQCWNNIDHVGLVLTCMCTR